MSITRNILKIKRNKVVKMSVNLIQINEYNKIMNENRHHFDRLNEIVKYHVGKNVEGNCFTQHEDVDNCLPELIYKQMNLFSLGRDAKNVMEIGFNAGHSCLLFLLSNPNSKITVFDLIWHSYVLPCFDYLQSVFPDRLQIIHGDSVKTVPIFHHQNPDLTFDLIHIDGSHYGTVANWDFYNSIKMATDIIIWDDTQISHLNELLDGYIKDGLVSEVAVHKTYNYEHREVRKV